VVDERSSRVSDRLTVAYRSAGRIQGRHHRKQIRTSKLRRVCKRPCAIIANSVLATATLVVQPFADVRLPTDQVQHISNYHASIAETGERKTASDGEAISAVRAY